MIDDVIEGIALRSPAPLSVLVAGPPALVTLVRAAPATLGIGEDRIESDLHGRPAAGHPPDGRRRTARTSQDVTGLDGATVGTRADILVTTRKTDQGVMET
jgi:hypothetical protein